MIRAAGPDDLVTLGELERAASTAALGHVFGDLPFPLDDVLARWRLVLDEPDVEVVIDEDDGVSVGYAAFGDGWLRHFGVHPGWWGTGRAQALHEHVTASLGSVGGGTLYLWVLEQNYRARAFYTRLGWVDNGVRDREVFAPYPVKVQMVWH